ncbi:MAG TPA: hypothetical protein PK185_07820 [Cyclobacteriaceae bacterium]|nr:hypothetical protein [Cyclobacteriaceae bacterium]
MKNKWLFIGAVIIIVSLLGYGINQRFQVGRLNSIVESNLQKELDQQDQINKLKTNLEECFAINSSIMSQKSN